MNGLCVKRNCWMNGELALKAGKILALLKNNIKSIEEKLLHEVASG